MIFAITRMGTRSQVSEIDPLLVQEIIETIEICIFQCTSFLFLFFLLAAYDENHQTHKKKNQRNVYKKPIENERERERKEREREKTNNNKIVFLIVNMISNNQNTQADMYHSYTRKRKGSEGAREMPRGITKRKST